jgi:hypothetical protein
VGAIDDFFRFAWGTLPNIAGVLGYSIFWGILDVLYGLVLLYAGYALLQGQAVGHLIALIVAVFAAIRWFFCICISRGRRWSSSASACSSSMGW